jgi:sugar phosphate isomerase/epimerase
MKVSVSSWSYRGPIGRREMDLLSFLDEVGRLGADGFEIYPQYLEQDDLAGSVQRVADRAEQLGLCISSIITQNDFACPTAAERAREVESVKSWVRIAASAGIRRLNTFTGHHNDGEAPSVEFHRVVDAYREVVRLAEENNVLLCLENVRQVLNDADGIMAVVQAVGSDYLRTNPDITNFAWSSVNRGEPAPEQAYADIEKVMGRASNVHLGISGFTDDGECAYLDMPRIVRILNDACYDEHIVLEVSTDTDPALVCERGVAMLRRHLAA